VHDVEHVLAADDGMGRRVLDALSARPDRSRLGAQIGRGTRYSSVVIEEPTSITRYARCAAGTDPVALVRLVEQRASAAASVPTSCSHGVGRHASSTVV
jgi:hypothetical protein